MKVIGQKKCLTPEENLRRLEALVREAEIIRPRPQKKRFVIRFKTWDELNEFNLTRAVRGL